MTQRAGRNFQNERGNQIDIDVSDEWGGPTDRSVMIRITGPDSSSTNLVTPMEAEMLRQALNEWAS